MSYELSEEQKKEFAGIYLLEFMINEPKSFNLFLENSDADLEPVLEWLLVKEYISIEKNERYVANKKGRKALKKFLRRYSEFLHFFDVFCAVDLSTGEFAFASFFEFEDESAWRAFLNEERWEDLRVTVASYKGIDPIEIVFMSFVQEQRFGRDESGWQFDLLLGSVWDDILEICNTAIRVEQLGYETDEGEVSGEVVIRDVITQGFALIDELHQQDWKANSRFGAEQCRSPNGYQSDLKPVDLETPDENAFRKYRDPDYRSDDWSRN